MKIAIVKLSALGDIIHAASVLEFIKKYRDDIEIDWIAESNFAAILENNPYISNIKKSEIKSIKTSVKNLPKEIKRVKSFGRYDLVIDLQGLLKSAIVSKILSKNVAGFDKASARESLASLFYTKSFDIPYRLNTIDRYRLLVSKALEIDITKEDILQKKPYLYYKDETNYFDKDGKNVIFVIGATWKSRIYPKELLLDVAKNLDADIYIPYANEDEKRRALWLEKNATNIKMLPKMDLNGLKATISKASLVIGNDTGPTYIAWANNIPSIILFGPTPPIRVYEDSKTFLLKSPSPVDPEKLDKNDYSIREIDPMLIVKKAKELLC
jgi:heptosyltransferase-1